MTWKKLEKLAKKATATRCGKTNDPHRRRGEYSREKYKGKMFYCKVDNTKEYENKLLGMKEWRDNVQTVSNVQKEEEGYVYVIVE